MPSHPCTLAVTGSTGPDSLIVTAIIGFALIAIALGMKRHDRNRRSRRAQLLSVLALATVALVGVSTILPTEPASAQTASDCAESPVVNNEVPPESSVAPAPESSTQHSPASQSATVDPTSAPTPEIVSSPEPSATAETEAPVSPSPASTPSATPTPTSTATPSPSLTASVLPTPTPTPAPEPTMAPTESVIWPLASYNYIGDGFRSRGGSHDGVDFLADGMTPIYAVADGVVAVSSESYWGYGVAVVLEHNVGGKSVSTLYGHMTYGTRQVNVGETVTAGQIIGSVGSTGSSTANNLHFEVEINGTLVDPMIWLKANASS